MKDLCAKTGLERQTIHFYIQEGLVPEGRKTGRNMAFYDDGHLERILLIKSLQRERFLPLRAIRAILGGKGGGFSKEQRALLADVKERLAGAARTRDLVAGPGGSVAAGDLAAATGLDVRDIEELGSRGLVAFVETGRVRQQDAWLVELWGELVAAGLTKARGFGPADLALVDEAVTALFEKERDLFLERLGHLSAEELATVLSRALPLLAELVSRMHVQKARDTFALAEAAADGSDGHTPASPSPSPSPSNNKRSAA
jgi:DNA-binding transcriptional MerR regulator